MKTQARILLATMFLLLGCSLLQAENSTEHAQRMAWWRNARFGMFIHWGVMSIPGKDFNVMEKDGIPIAEYEKLAQQYNPVKWNAHDVVKMAKDAGQKYLVFVAKHHDGFAMWDSKASGYNIMHTPYGKDIVRQLADECAKQDVVFCFYYSILDWHHPDANKENWPKYVEFMKSQLRELLTCYGPIGVVWFDGDWIPLWTDQQGRELAEFVWSLQPNTIINNRVGKVRQTMPGETKDRLFAADFETPEQEVPPYGLPGVDWESCMTINHSWSWNKTDLNHKSPAECLRLLVDTVSKGGNLLLNIGPHPDGSILPEQQECLQSIGKWMQINHEAVFGTTASPFEKQLPWGRCTRKTLGNGKTCLYLHVFDWPKDGKLVMPSPHGRVSQAFLLGDSQKAPLKCETATDKVTIGVPATPPDPIVSVVALELVEK